MRRSAWVGAAAAAGLVAGCASKPAPAPRPEPVAPPAAAPAPPPPPPPALGWADLPLTPGDWVYSRDGAASQALFGAPASEAQFVVRCDPARRQVILSREGTARRLHVRTSTENRTLDASVRTEPLAVSSATLPASDALLDAIAFSRGRFSVEGEGQPLLVIPAWPEPARVIEDCRS